MVPDNEFQFNDSNKETENESKFQPVDGPGVLFKDIAGLEDIKKEINESIILPIKRPDLFESMKLDMNTGILFYGPPGTGKTMLAQAIATEVDAKFFIAKSSELVSSHPGESERNIADLFESARKYDRSIVFFDEFESLGMSRDIGSNQDIYSSQIAELLRQMQGFDDNNKSLVLLAATNRPWDIDPALLRPGRFGIHIYVGLPDFEARYYLIKSKFKGVPVDPSVDLFELATWSEGFSAADVSNLCDRIKLNAIVNDPDASQVFVEEKNVEDAFNLIHSSVTPFELAKFKKFKEGKSRRQILGAY